MESKIDVVLKFISENFSNVNFEITHNVLSPTLKHFVIRDSYGNKGFGTDHDYLTAIHKSYSEYVERRCFKFLNDAFDDFKTSNGFASHTSLKKSTNNSVFELIERDAFLVSWHGNHAPYWLSSTEIEKIVTPQNLQILANHSKSNLTIDLGIVAQTGEVLTCICKVKGSRKNDSFFYIDTKSGNDLIMIMNSLIESISFFSHHFILGHVKSQDFKAQIKKPIDHFYYYFNNPPSVDWFHKGSSDVINLPRFSIETFVIPAADILGISNLKRYATYSESSESQNYYCGNFKNANINMLRFNNVFGKKLKFNKAIHPLS